MSSSCLCGLVCKCSASTIQSVSTKHMNLYSSKLPYLVNIFSTIFLMNVWYIHLVLSNLNWAITAAMHLVSLIFNVSIYINQSSSEETLEMKISAVIIKLIVCIVYLWLAYFTDQQKKINFCIKHTL